jgi:hypothetical protein
MSAAGRRSRGAWGSQPTCWPMPRAMIGSRPGPVSGLTCGRPAPDPPMLTLADRRRQGDVSLGTSNRISRRSQDERAWQSSNESPRVHESLCGGDRSGVRDRTRSRVRRVGRERRRRRIVRRRSHFRGARGVQDQSAREQWSSASSTNASPPCPHNSTPRGRRTPTPGRAQLPPRRRRSGIRLARESRERSLRTLQSLRRGRPIRAQSSRRKERSADTVECVLSRIVVGAEAVAVTFSQVPATTVADEQ